MRQPLAYITDHISSYINWDSSHRLRAIFPFWWWASTLLCWLSASASSSSTVDGWTFSVVDGPHLEKWDFCLLKGGKTKKQKTKNGHTLHKTRSEPVFEWVMRKLCASWPWETDGTVRLALRSDRFLNSCFNKKSVTLKVDDCLNNWRSRHGGGKE